MRRLRVGLGQINCTVGDLEGNTRKILDYIARAKALGVDLLAFPELAITGYPPEDLLLKPQFIKDNRQRLEEIVPHTQGIAVVVGFVDAADDIYNAAAVICDGKLVDIYHKMYLPNYGVFDEDRYFQTGTQCSVYELDGVGVGVNICEDIWYPTGPTTYQSYAEAEVIVNINSSPYHAGKGSFREKMLATRATDNTVIVTYTNLVGGQDELVFDGNSMIINERGEVIARGRSFEEDLVVADLETAAVFRTRLHDPRRRKEKLGSQAEMERAVRKIVSTVPVADAKPPLLPSETIHLDPVAEVYQALVLGTRDYVRKNGFRKVLVGLSGGIDSSLTAVIAADALGPENVVGVTMPSRYSSRGSVLDSRRLAKNLGMELLRVPIEPAFRALLGVLEKPFQSAAPNVAEENLQARIRGNILMALSNKFGWLVLTTGNKSELAMGYATLYGDMAGGFAMLKDVPKTMVYELARHRNHCGLRAIIPRSVMEKAPSAELKPNQLDIDTLPPYPILDPILQGYVEEDRSYDEIVSQGHDPEVVKRVITMVDRAEYKRRQSPPGIKITPRAFGKDRRLPIVNHYRSF